MRRHRVVLVLAGAAVAWCAALLAVACAGGGSAPGVWGQAIEVPGLGKLNAGGNAEVESVSCASAGDCAAGGLYTDGSGFLQAFVASEVNGRWRAAIEVPGTGKLNVGGTAWVLSVSCPAAGGCVAGGRYAGSDHSQAFVASEVNGRWGKAIEVPGTATLNAGRIAEVTAVSCASPGNCAAGGSYQDGSAYTQAFVAGEVNGRWRAAIEVPGTGRLNAGGNAQVLSVSCAAPGDCLAGGRYTERSQGLQTFVASEVNGRWRAAIKVPGTATLNAGKQALVYSVSCASAGNCAAGGFYTGRSHNQQAFVASEVNGRWRAAIEVPGSGKLNTGGTAQVESVSCASAGNCAAGGGYWAPRGKALVASEVNGRWRAAIELPGSRRLDAGGGAASLLSVSCASAGNCAAGGLYSGGSGHPQALVASEVNGRWQAAIEVPGTAKLNASGPALVVWVSCAPAGNCAAGGSYQDGSGHHQAFVVSQT